jgi:5-methylcytosine-specific restriction endonuclease McrA
MIGKDLNHSHREDYNSPEYKSWRYSVFVRDGFQCQLTGQKGGDLEAHHIIRWADAPHLRYVTSNGITLSKASHELVNGREKEFEELFKKLVHQKKISQAKEKGKTVKTPQPKGKWRPRNVNLRY